MQIIEDYKQATRNALEVGFDGVEVHSGNVRLPIYLHHFV